MDTMIDKYTYRIEWSDEDKCHVARCLEFQSLGAHGKTAEKALKEIRAVVAASIAWMQEENELVPEPLSLRKYKGHLTLRIPPDKHRELAIKSAEAGVSMNQFLLSRL